MNYREHIYSINFEYYIDRFSIWRSCKKIEDLFTKEVSARITQDKRKYLERGFTEESAGLSVSNIYLCLLLGEGFFEDLIDNGDSMNFDFTLLAEKYPESEIAFLLKAVNQYTSEQSFDNFVSLIMEIGNVYFWIEVCKTITEKLKIPYDFDFLERWVTVLIRKTSTYMDVKTIYHRKSGAMLAQVVRGKIRDHFYTNRTVLIKGIVDPPSDLHLSEEEVQAEIATIKEFSTSNKEIETQIVRAVLQNYFTRASQRDLKPREQ